MSKFADVSFSEDQLSSYGQVVAVFQKILAKSKLAGLEYLALQLTDVIEKNRVPLPQGEVGDFIHEVVAKAVNEAWGLIGCFRAGAYTSSFHHGRSIIELYAALCYVFNNHNKIKKRTKKFFAYRRIYIHNHYIGLKKLIETGKITEEVYRARCLVSDDMFQEIQKHIGDLAKLFDVQPDELHKVESWHYPARISNLLEVAYERALNQKKKIKDETPDQETQFDDLSKIYNQFCEMTHLSPLSAHIVGASLMFGYPLLENGGVDCRALNRPISVVLIVMSDIVRLIEEELKVNIDITMPGF